MCDGPFRRRDLWQSCLQCGNGLLPCSIVGVYRRQVPGKFNWHFGPMGNFDCCNHGHSIFTLNNVPIITCETSTVTDFLLMTRQEILLSQNFYRVTSDYPTR